MSIPWPQQSPTKMNDTSQKIVIRILASAGLTLGMCMLVACAIFVAAPGHVYAVVLELNVDDKDSVDFVTQEIVEVCVSELGISREGVEICQFSPPNSTSCELTVTIWENVSQFKRAEFLRRVDRLRNLLDDRFKEH